MENKDDDDDDDNIKSFVYFVGLT